MNNDDLSRYFDSVAVKRLSAVEVDPHTSNQHEFNGSEALKRVLGTGSGERQLLPARFIRITDSDDDNDGPIFRDTELSWYDARRNHKTRSEYRLYHPAGLLAGNAREGDLLFLVRCTGGELLMIVAQDGSTGAQQLHWLFGQSMPGELQSFTGGGIEPGRILPPGVFMVLDELGVALQEDEGDRLDALLEPIGDTLPATKEFSAFARQTLPGISPEENPDAALLAWLDHEERLFRRFERRGIENRLNEGFEVDGELDVDGFISYSLSIQNRRKSRVGQAFEHHIGAVFDAHNVQHARGVVTENRSKPDFLFPGIDEYKNTDFPATSLTMLGAKTTCKDRWRQVLTEAQRITDKHLITVEPSISEAQTAEMQHHRLQLVVPQPLHETYQPEQREWLIGLRDFLQILDRRSAVKRGEVRLF